MTTTNWVSSLGDLVLGVDPPQRLRIKYTLMTAVIYAICVLLLAYGAHIDQTDPFEAALLSGCIFVSTGTFYLLLRSGWSRRLRDPSLTYQQILVAQTWISGSYAITGIAHPATLTLLALVLVFGIFNLSARNARNASGYTVVVMGAVIVFKTITDPQVYSAKVEWVYFAFVLTIMPTITLLAVRLTSMREKLKAQKRDLEAKNAALEAALVRIEEIATRDQLTGLYNRRHILEIIHGHVKLQARSGYGFSLVVVDLDHFKFVNDQYGHGVGDEVLRSFARAAVAVMRETEVVARWGGEEFLILLPETSPSELTAGLTRLRQSLVNLQVSSSVAELRITFSAGATEHRTGDSIDQTIERADQALYMAKSQGRNRTVVA